MNYFDLFNLEKSIQINQEKLERKYIELQRLHHPDLSGNNEAGNLDIILKINEAYRTLKNELDRIQYLLSILGVDLDNFKGMIDPKFLQEILDDTEKATSEHDHSVLEKMLKEKTNMKENIMHAICDCFAKNMIEEMAMEFIKYKYLNSVLSTIKSKTK